MNYDTKPTGHRRLAAIIASGVVALLSLGFLGSGALLLVGVRSRSRTAVVA